MLLGIYLRFVHAAMHLLLRLALALDGHSRRLPRRVRKLRGSLRRAYEVWRLRHGLPPSGPPPPSPVRRANRTPDAVERQVICVHLEQPELGAGQLRLLVARVAGIVLARETIRRILIRRQDLVRELLAEPKKKPQRIQVHRPLELWGADLALVFVLGVLPVWLLGIVDYHGSRLMAVEVLPFPTSKCVASAVERAIKRHGAPKRILTDNGSVFLAPPVQEVLARYEVTHTRTRPAHPWTNGRIERIWRTFRETLRQHYWLLASREQLVRVCADFVVFYNECRPHSAFDGRTPDEVFHGRLATRRVLNRVTFFDGGLHWYRFG